MNRQEFFRRLEYLLRGIPECERQDALAYYNDYFDDAGVENEQQVIQELGSPEQVAQIILEDYHRNKQYSYESYDSSKGQYTESYAQSQASHEKKTIKKSFVEKIKDMSTTSKVLLIIILVLTFPVWIGVVTGVFGGIVGLLGGLFGMVVGVGGAGIGIFFAGIVCLIVGVLRLFATPIEGVVTIGIGALSLAISILLILLFALLAFKWLPTVVKAVVKWIKGLCNPQEGGDEI